MEKAAEEFLKNAGVLYTINKKSWRTIIEKKGYQFSEDIYNDSIVKTYDAIRKKETDTTDYLSYWFKTFLNNTMREKKYNNNKTTSIDEETNEENEEW